MAATEMRPPARISKNWRSPAPRGPSRFSAGTRAPANESSRVSEARQPSFCIGGEIAYPGVPFGTTMFEISPSPVTAVIVTSALMSVPAFVMKIFEPSRCLRRAGVGAGFGLRQAERRELAARRELRQPALPLLLVPEVEDRQRPERVVRGDGDRD